MRTLIIIIMVNAFLNKQIAQSMVCMVVVSVFLQFVLPMILTMPALDGVLRGIPMVGDGAADVLASHKTNQAGGAVVLALITIVAAYLAPILCPMLGGL